MYSISGCLKNPNRFSAFNSLFGRSKYMSDWNYDMKSCPLDTKVHLLSSDDCFLLPQREYVGTITHNGRFKTRGKCYNGDPDYFYRSAIVAWKPFE